MNLFATQECMPTWLRPILMHALGPSVGHSMLHAWLTVVGSNVTLKDDALVNWECISDSGESSTQTEDGVAIGVRCVFSAVTHESIEEPCGARAIRSKPITIERGSWIGGNVTVLPDVRINQFSTVGAGAIVTRDLPAGGVYAGVPTRRIGRFNIRARPTRSDYRGPSEALRMQEPSHKRLERRCYARDRSYGFGVRGYESHVGAKSVVSSSNF